MTHCKVCGTLLGSTKEMFCQRHQKLTLKKLEASGYLEPLQISTVDGPNQRLSRRRFLTVLDPQE